MRVRRDDLVTFHVDGTHGSAVAGLTDCMIQPRAATPKPVWNPDIPQPIDFFDDWQDVPANRAYDNAFKVEWELFLAPRRRRRAVPVEPARRREGRAARRARAARAGPSGAGSTCRRSRPDPMPTLKLPHADGDARAVHAARRPRSGRRPASAPRWNRVAFAAAHVVADPLAQRRSVARRAHRLGRDARLSPPPVVAGLRRRRGDGHRAARHGARLADVARADPAQRRRSARDAGRGRVLRRRHRPPRARSRRRRSTT